MSPYTKGMRFPDDPEGENMTNAGDLVKSGGSAIFASIVRTFVPLLVGVVVAALTKLGVPADDDSVAQLVNGVVSAAISLGYYAGVRALEVFGSSKFGWLLGYAKAPVYVADKV